MTPQTWLRAAIEEAGGSSVVGSIGFERDLAEAATSAARKDVLYAAIRAASSAGRVSAFREILGKVNGWLKPRSVRARIEDKAQAYAAISDVIDLVMAVKAACHPESEMQRVVDDGMLYAALAEAHSYLCEAATIMEKTR